LESQRRQLWRLRGEKIEFESHRFGFFLHRKCRNAFLSKKEMRAISFLVERVRKLKRTCAREEESEVGKGKEKIKKGGLIDVSHVN
jgi:hypothetical protein